MFPAKQTYKPGSVGDEACAPSRTAIHLGRELPRGSSHLPAGSDGPPFGTRRDRLFAQRAIGAAADATPAYVVLLRVGFAVPCVSPRPR